MISVLRSSYLYVMVSSSLLRINGSLRRPWTNILAKVTMLIVIVRCVDIVALLERITTGLRLNGVE